MHRGPGSLCALLRPRGGPGAVLLEGAAARASSGRRQAHTDTLHHVATTQRPTPVSLQNL